MRFSFLLFITLTTIQGALSQKLFFHYGGGIPVEENGKKLRNPWVGGINAAQISRIDLNNDGTEDLVLFDKTSGTIKTFLTEKENTKSFFKHHPEYELLFPELTAYLIAADFNCDGKKDLFTSASFGDVRVYKNISKSNEKVAFTLETGTLMTKSSSGPYSIHISQSDYPSIVDLDNDGDLDIVTFDPSNGHFAQMHKNLSKENLGKCDVLNFEKVGSCWGNFMKGHDCGQIEFGQDCGTSEGMRVLHSGSTSLILDLDGDDIKDIMFGSVGCDNVVSLKNSGTSINANFTSIIQPLAQAETIYFPASFFEDVDHDGIKDLTVSPNIMFNEGNLNDFESSVLFYKNKGSNSFPVFELVQKNFLQDDMIDLGEYSYPVLVDIDNDEDLDLIVGSRGKIHSDKTFYATLVLYENVGSKEAASFKLVNSDYLGFSNYKFQNLKPSFIDLNNDGMKDFVFTHTDPSTATTSLSYILNSATSPNNFNVASAVKLSITLKDYDTPVLYDVDNDQVLDLIIGKSQGRLEFYKNTGTNVVPSFTLVNSTFGGIQNNFSNNNTFPALFDLDQNGSKELLISDRSGKLKIFPKWQSEVDAAFTNAPNFLFNENINQYVEPFFGAEVFPTAGDLDGDGFPEMILGTNGGGLIFLTNDTKVNGTEKHLSENIFKVYPNPTSNVLSIETKIPGSITIYSALGQQKSTKFMILNNTDINISNYEKGMYIIRFSTQDGKIYSRKIIKE